MSIELITLLMIGSLLLLLIIGMPMAFALGFVAVAFAYAFFGWSALQLISSRIYGFVSVYVLIAVPMFLLMASIMDRSGVARELYDAMSVWAGGLPGGVAIMTLVAAVFMAATTGIIGGEIILLGLVALRLRQRRGERGIEAAADQDVEQVETGEQQARHDHRDEQLADRDVRGQAVEDQDDRGRDHGAERAAGADRADREVLVVAEPQHLGQGDQPEQDDLAPDDPGGRGHEHRGEQRHDRDAAGQAAGPDAHGVIELARHA